MRSMPLACDPVPHFLVPDDQVALVLRDGLPQGVRPPGLHALPPGRVEVRLFAACPPAAWLPGTPSERSLLYLEGTLVGILVQGRTGTAVGAWEGAGPRPAPDRPRSGPARSGFLGLPGNRPDELLPACLSARPR